MRDENFKALHRGGLLTKENHQLFLRWAIDCSLHIFHYLGKPLDFRLLCILKVAENWINGDATVGEARKVSVTAHQIARESTDDIFTALARAIGHTAATPHMADHSLGAALYAQKAASLAGKSVEKLINLQISFLPDEIKDIAIKGLVMKGQHFKFGKRYYYSL